MRYEVTVTATVEAPDVEYVPEPEAFWLCWNKNDQPYWHQVGPDEVEVRLADN